MIRLAVLWQRHGAVQCRVDLFKRSGGTAGFRRMRGGICAGVGRKPPMNQKNAEATNQHMMMPCQLSANFCCSTAKAEAAMLPTGVPGDQRPAKPMTCCSL